MHLTARLLTSSWAPPGILQMMRRFPPYTHMNAQRPALKPPQAPHGAESLRPMLCQTQTADECRERHRRRMRWRIPWLLQHAPGLSPSMRHFVVAGRPRGKQMSSPLSMVEG